MFLAWFVVDLFVMMLYPMLRHYRRRVLGHFREPEIKRPWAWDAFVLLELLHGQVTLMSDRVLTFWLVFGLSKFSVEGKFEFRSSPAAPQ